MVTHIKTILQCSTILQHYIYERVKTYNLLKVTKYDFNHLSTHWNDVTYFADFEQVLVKPF